MSSLPGAVRWGLLGDPQHSHSGWHLEEPGSPRGAPGGGRFPSTGSQSGHPWHSCKRSARLALPGAREPRLLHAGVPGGCHARRQSVCLPTPGELRPGCRCRSVGRAQSWTGRDPGGTRGRGAEVSTLPRSSGNLRFCSVLLFCNNPLGDVTWPTLTHGDSSSWFLGLNAFLPALLEQWGNIGSGASAHSGAGTAGPLWGLGAEATSPGHLEGAKPRC